MFTSNPFAELSASIAPSVMQIYSILRAPEHLSASCWQ
jgi:hypothetical protein